MTLRDALAASLWEPWEGHPTGGHCLVCGDDSADLAVAAHDAADAILSDHAFREALVESVAEAMEPFDVIDYRVDPHGDIMGITAAAAIVARMLP